MPATVLLKNYQFRVDQALLFFGAAACDALQYFFHHWLSFVGTKYKTILHLRHKECEAMSTDVQDCKK